MWGWTVWVYREIWDSGQAPQLGDTGLCYLQMSEKEKLQGPRLPSGSPRYTRNCSCTLPAL